MDLRTINALLSARALLKADASSKDDPDKKDPEWNEADHPRDSDGKFGSGGNIADAAKIAADVGRGLPGYIAPDRAERSAFNSTFPPISTTDAFDPGTLSYIEGAQASLFSIDQDSRFSNHAATKAPDGVRVTFTNGVITQSTSTPSNIATTTAIGASLGGATAVRAGAIQSNGVGLTAGSQARLASSGVAAGAVIGAIGGAIGYAINESLANSAQKDMINAEPNYGARMEVASSRNTVIPNIYSRKESITKISDGVYKVDYITKTFDPKDIADPKSDRLDDGLPAKRYAAKVTTVVTYRGPEYNSKYPNTKGWEQSVTNIVVSNKYTATSGLPSPSGTAEQNTALSGK